MPLATYYSPLATYNLLLATRQLLHTTRHLPLTTYCSLLIDVLQPVMIGEHADMKGPPWLSMDGRWVHRHLISFTAVFTDRFTLQSETRQLIADVSPDLTKLTFVNGSDLRYIPTKEHDLSPSHPTLPRTLQRHATHPVPFHPIPPNPGTSPRIPIRPIPSHFTPTPPYHPAVYGLTRHHHLGTASPSCGRTCRGIGVRSCLTGALAPCGTITCPDGTLFR